MIARNERNPLPPGPGALWAGFAPRLLLAAALVLVIVLSLRRMADSDLWGHLACGTYLLDTGHILKTHYFNCSWPAFPYVNHSWLFQAVIALVERATGEPGLIALQVGLVLLAFFVLYRIIRVETDRMPVIAFVLTLGILASMHRFALRPQHFTYVFLLLFLYALRQYQRGSSRSVWYLPPIMLLWGNMHAESLWGILILGTFLVIQWLRARSIGGAIGSSWKRSLLLFGVVLVAAMINPFTYKTVLWPFFVMKEQFAGVEEILPPTSVKFLYFWIYCAVFAVVMALNRRRVDPFWLVLSAMFLAVAWTANRGIPHFIFVSAPLLAGNIDALVQRGGERFPEMRRLSVVAPLVILAAMLALIASIVTSPLYLQKFDNIPYPDAAITFLKKQGVRANVINEHMWGGYIIWTSYPDLRPYIDGRFFHKQFYEEYYPLLAGRPGWERVLDGYGITAAILRYSPSQKGTLNDRLFQHPEWKLVYWDDEALVYLKATAANRPVINRYGNGLFNVDRDPYNTFLEQPHAFVLKVNAVAERNAESAPGSAKAAIVAGNTWFALGEHAKALGRYSEARERLRVPNPGLLYHMALCYRSQGDLTSTAVYLKQVLEIAPEAEQARTMLNEVQYLLRAQEQQHQEGKESPVH